MDILELDSVFDWRPSERGVSSVSVGSRNAEAEPHFFACLSELLNQFGEPHEPRPLPDLASHRLADWVLTLSDGRAVPGAFWITEWGWRSLQYDVGQKRTLYLVNNS